MDQVSYQPIDTEAPAAVIAVDRAVGDLRRGGAVVLADAAGGGSLVLSSEYANARRLARLDALPGGAVVLIVTAQRARVLGLGPGAGPVVALPLASPPDWGLVHDLSDPAAEIDAGRALAGLSPGIPHARDSAAVALAKLASLLPAVLTKTLDGAGIGDVAAWAAARDLLVVRARDIDRHAQLAPAALERISAARVPLADAEDTTIVTFRPIDGGAEHLAMVIGAPAAPVLARIHSQCFTGDLLGSLRCDCGDQLRGAVRHIAGAGGGVVLYLAQEGRGIGLVNKLRAYQLQDQGLDTFAANQQLGFDADERHWRAAAEMLRQLGFTRVRLLTNNPDKIAGLARSGIEVVERVPHAVPPNPHNARYLETKRARGGHLL